ncbi:probable WRKY transcription factor 19 [Prosopis cineraria]|uniref:probable WRKY transcription factor 19 n=1 Tax=Prosopis cineraria TaxID=364024 RepID=UPI00240ECC57|nr:probable WRKY transcription factor 19 [Prosopis cineraria]
MHGNKATFKVEAIVLDLEDSQRSQLGIKNLSRTSRFRLLIFRNVKFSGVLKHLSYRLRYTSWHQYPFTSLPTYIFYPYSLREFILPDSSITSIWDEEKVSPHSQLPTHTDVRHWRREKIFYCSRNMNLCGSKDLTKMPNFKEFPELERLDLEGQCTKL